MEILAISSSCRFVSAPYVADEAGRLRATIPESCPKARLSGTCSIERFGFRERVFGPRHDLELMYCALHEHYFTVYPPGWIPYKRDPLVPLTPCGHPIVVDQSSNGEQVPIWSFSIFRGIVEAGLGKLWPEEGQLGVEVVPGEVPGVLRTQQRCIKFFMQILGLLSTSHRKLRERVSELLNLTIAGLENSRRRMCTRSRAPPLWKIRGELGKGILESIGASELIYRKLILLVRHASKNSQSTH